MGKRRPAQDCTEASPEVAERVERWPIRSWVACALLLGVLASVSCGGGGGGGSVAQVTVPTTTANVDPSGGTIQVVDATDPLYGASLTIPPGAIPAGETAQIVLTSQSAPPGALEPGSGIVAASPTLLISKTGSRFFQQPVTLTLPYSISGQQQAGTPCVFYWDEDLGRYRYMNSVGIDRTNHRVSIETNHCSSYIVFGLPDLTKILDTRLAFDPDLDGLTINNPTGMNSKYTTGGCCLGASAFVKWFWDHQKTPGNPLSTVIPKAEYQDEIAIRAQQDAGSQISTTLETSLIEALNFGDPADMGADLWLILRATHSPVVLAAFLNLNQHLFSAHAVVVYGFDAPNGRFLIWDPNEDSSGSHKATLDYNLISGLHNLSSDPGFVFFTPLAFDPSLPDADLATLFSGSQQSWGGGYFSQITVAGAVDGKLSYNKGQNLAISGKVTGGNAGPVQIGWFRNAQFPECPRDGSLPSEISDVSADGSFTLDLPPILLDGTIQMALVATGSSGTFCDLTDGLTLLTVAPAPATAAPVISSFVAVPSSIHPGDTSMLQWSVTGEDSLSLSSDDPTDQPGAVTGTTSRPVTPSATRTYTLTATNSIGSSQQKATVTVGSAAPTSTYNLPGNVALDLILIPSGQFMMGRYQNEQDSFDIESPQHQVSLSSFYMAKFETTQEQWVAIMGSNPSLFTGDSTRPVEQVSYDDITAATTGYLARLNAQQAGNLPTGMSFRLPTEAEWEYACRANTSTRFYWGDDPNYTEINNYAWFQGNSGNTTHGTGDLKQPNAFGLYNMSGNVWEWVQDGYSAYSAEALQDPPGPASEHGSLLRGGSFVHQNNCRSAYRINIDPGVNYDRGFRLVLGAPRPSNFVASGNSSLGADGRWLISSSSGNRGMVRSTAEYAPWLTGSTFIYHYSIEPQIPGTAFTDFQNYCGFRCDGSAGDYAEMPSNCLFVRLFTDYVELGAMVADSYTTVATATKAISSGKHSVEIHDGAALVQVYVDGSLTLTQSIGTQYQGSSHNYVAFFEREDTAANPKFYIGDLVVP